MNQPQPDTEDYRVAVTVFATVRHGDVRDQRDANNRVVDAVQQALDAVDAGLDPDLPTVPAGHRTLPTIHVTTYGVMETATAGINSYLAVVPTSRAFPRPGPPADTDSPADHR
jgi:hypothetical protein